jgi:alpha-glucosidase
LWFARSLIALRKQTPALVTGDMKVLAVTEQVLAFERVSGADHILCLFNLSASDASFDIGDAGGLEPLPIKIGEAAYAGGSLTVGARSAMLAKRAS